MIKSSAIKKAKILIQSDEFSYKEIFFNHRYLHFLQDNQPMKTEIVFSTIICTILIILTMVYQEPDHHTHILSPSITTPIAIIIFVLFARLTTIAPFLIINQINFNQQPQNIIPPKSIYHIFQHKTYFTIHIIGIIAILPLIYHNFIPSHPNTLEETAALILWMWTCFMCIYILGGISYLTSSIHTTFEIYLEDKSQHAIVALYRAVQ